MYSKTYTQKKERCTVRHKYRKTYTQKDMHAKYKKKDVQ